MAVMHSSPGLHSAPKEAQAMSFRGTAGTTGPIEDFVTTLSLQLPELQSSSLTRTQALSELSSMVEKWYMKVVMASSSSSDTDSDGEEEDVMDVESITPFRARHLRARRRRVGEGTKMVVCDSTEACPGMTRALFPPAVNTTDPPLPVLRNLLPQEGSA